MAERDPSDPTWYRRVLGQYPTGVCVVTGIGPDERPTGLVVGSFSSVSLDPPIVGFFPDRSSSSWPKIRPSKRFCVNILAHDQEHLCRQFAAKGADKFAGVDWRPGPTGSPILECALAWIDCDIAGTHEVGDHDLVLGRVRELDVGQPADPLLFFRGGYGRFSPLSLAIGDVQLGPELRLVDRARSAMEVVAEELRAQCTAWALVGDELVLLATAGTPHGVGIPASMVGARLPAVPPAGSTWMAYAAPARFEQWLDRAPGAEREQHRARVAQARERGYTVGLHGPGLASLDAAVRSDQLTDPGPLLRSLELDPLDFDLDDAPRVATINVPVLGPDGEVELMLGLHGFARLADRAALEHAVARLRAIEIA